MKTWLASIPAINLVLIVLTLAISLFLLAYLSYLVRRFWRGLNSLELKDRFAIKNDFIKTAAQILGGAFFLITIYFTYQNLALSQKNLMATQEKNITDLYVKAIDQLGKEQSLEAHIGGIYALERIARDSAKDHVTIMEVLTAYVRQHAPAPKTFKTPTTQEELRDEQLRKPKADVEAALTVIGRRNMTFGQGRLDLNETDLRGANLKGAHLEGALFWRSHLEGADLRGTHLEKADLRFAYLEWSLSYGVHLEGANLLHAHLERAYLQQAHLEGAQLISAHLEGAQLQSANMKGANLNGSNLQRSNLKGADLEKAILKSADLRGTDLSFVKGLTREQLAEAIMDEETRKTLPDYLREPQPEKPEPK